MMNSKHATAQQSAAIFSPSVCQGTFPLYVEVDIIQEGCLMLTGVEMK